MTGAPWIGRALPRVDGRAKVTGGARYAAELEAPGLVHAVVVSATVGLGRIVAIDGCRTEQGEGGGGAAARMPGVLAVLSHLNAPRLAYGEYRSFVDPAFGERLHVLQDDEVRFFGQPVAVVVAGTLDEAEHAAAAVRVEYEARAPVVRMDAAEAAEVVPEAARRPGTRGPADAARGDADGALAGAAVRIDATYGMARENHNPMEPHAAVAAWDGDRLTLWSKSQFVGNEAAEIEAIFGLPAGGVRVVSPFVGGGFGTSLRTWPHVTLAALAARHVGRPVKLVLSRRQMFYSTGHRPATVQRIALGAAADGRLAALIHEGRGETSRYEQFIEALTASSLHLYSCPNVRTRYRLVPLDSGTPTYMRGPGEASGVFALECAMDELAVALGMDPIALRLRNEPAPGAATAALAPPAAMDEGRNLPYSSRSLAACYAAGAARFGWERRDPRPGSLRDGRLRLGWGMAAATYPASRGAASARARLLADGTAEVEAAASDMGPGTYTSMTQVAADGLGLDPAAIRFRLGQSEYPATPPHGGSMTMASVGSAVQAACASVREKAVRCAVGDRRSPLFGAAVAAVDVVEGRMVVGIGDDVGGAASGESGASGVSVASVASGEAYGELIARHGGAPIEAEASSAGGEERKQFSMHAFGAVFAEVAVDAELGTVRLRRAVGAYAAGRIVNPLLARSQCFGGMVGGLGMALLEQTLLDPRDGRPVNASLADYLVPVNLDVGALDVVFVDESDTEVNPLGVKGLGEIALVGMAPAIANAVFHATGRRVRELPIRVASLL